MSSFRKRYSRTRRRAGVRVRLGDRDEAVLASLARFGLARTSDLLRLVFPGVRRDTALRRLRRLFDAGYLAAEARDLSQDNLYRLGPEGRTWAEGQDLSVCRAPVGAYEHHLAVVRIWTEIARLAHENTGLSLVSFRPDWDLRGSPDALASAVVPDALVALSVATAAGTALVHVALEVDLGTERAGTLRRKIEAYRVLLVGGEGVWGVADCGLAVAAAGWSPARTERFGRMMAALWPGWWLFWSLETGPAEALKLLVAELASPLTASPCGQGREGVVTDEFVRSWDSRGERLSHED